jgi:DNA-binding HxlR family transcriptional regulator
MTIDPRQSKSEPGPALADLFHRRWGIPVLAALHNQQGAKFATLVHATAASPTSIRQTLDHLIAHAWVIPNPGYGHPLRPEYILTPAGERLGPAAAELDRVLLDLDLRTVALRKWSMPTLASMAAAPRRFGELARAMPGITDRALSLTLSNLVAVPLAARLGPTGGVPEYTPVRCGTLLASRVRELAATMAGA